jgi:hypothetical protein
MTEKLYPLWHSIGDVHGWIAFSLGDLTGSTGCRDFLDFSATLDTLRT